MKVGLVPLLYKEYNYGGVLQFYALQKALKNNGIECEIIFFRNDEKLVYYNFSLWRKLLSRIKCSVLYLFNRVRNTIIERNVKVRKLKIDAFKKKYYVKIFNEDSVKYSEFDAIVCGSDQIWNPNWAKKRCFLEFVPDEVNKIIYAASFGCERLDSFQKRQFMPRIQRLQHVSVREISGKKILDDLIGKNDVEVVLDPTLLLSAEEWKQIAETHPKKDRYVFLYFLGNYADKIQIIRKFAKNKGLKIVNIPFASCEKVDLNHIGDIEVVDADPAEFLGLIKDADYVFTDSFHACVFSILFHKQFFVFKRDNKAEMYGRINTLLSNFDLPDRCIGVDTDINAFHDIDFRKIESRQNELRGKSLDFLIGSIKNGEK